MGSIRVSKSKQIYVRFRYGEKQREEPTQYYCKNKGEPTTSCKCVSCNSARAIAYSVTKSIRDNTFDYADGKNISKALPVLPINLNVVAEASNTLLGKDITFNEYAVRWINALTLQPSTERSYCNHMKKLSLVFGDMVITQIVPIMIKEYKKTIEHYSPKYQKNILTTFSIIMESAKNDRLIDENPLKFVSKPKVTLMKADPFFIKDVKKIIQYMEQTSPHMTAFFAIGFLWALEQERLWG